MLEHGLRVVVLLVGGGLRLDGIGLAAGDLPGEGAQHAGAGDPAFDALPVRGQHWQPVASVDFQLAQRLAERF